MVDHFQRSFSLFRYELYISFREKEVGKIEEELQLTRKVLVTTFSIISQPRSLNVYQAVIWNICSLKLEEATAGAVASSETFPCQVPGAFLSCGSVSTSGPSGLEFISWFKELLWNQNILRINLIRISFKVYVNFINHFI